MNDETRNSRNDVADTSKVPAFNVIEPGKAAAFYSGKKLMEYYAWLAEEVSRLHRSAECKD